MCVSEVASNLALLQQSRFCLLPSGTLKKHAKLCNINKEATKKIMVGMLDGAPRLLGNTLGGHARTKVTKCLEQKSTHRETRRACPGIRLAVRAGEDVPAI